MVMVSRHGVSRGSSAPALPIAALLVAAAGACGAPHRAVVPAEPPLCSADDLGACERRLEGDPSHALAAAYVAARLSRDPGDRWAALYRGLDAPDRGAHRGVALIVEGDAPVGATSLPSTRVAALPAPSFLDADALLLALSAATGYRQILHVARGAVTVLYPADPLAPWMAGLRPVLRDADAITHAPADIAAEDALREAIDAAGAFRYVDAAKATERLESIVRGDPSDREPIERWRFALKTLGAAGLVLEGPDAVASASSSHDAAAPADESPYGAYLRVVTARDPQKAWLSHGSRVLQGLVEDRRASLAALYVASRDCVARVAPPMAGVRDLVFADALSGALERDASGPAPGQLALRPWLDRYEALVGLVDRTRSAWSYLPSLLRQRGEVSGVAPNGTAAYRRVTDLGVAHIAATKALEEAFPARHSAFTSVGLATSAGALMDDELRRPLVKLIEASMQDRIAAAPDASGLLGALATGVALGSSYPPAFQEPHFTALAGALAARLHGDLARRAGWDVALLYGIDAVYRVSTDRGPTPAWSADQIGRALAGPSVEEPALAALVAALARYAALAIGHTLDPARLRPDELDPARRVARERLRAAIAGLGQPGEAPANVLDDVTTLADGLIATLASSLAAGARPKSAAKSDANGACGAKSTALPLDPGLRRALGKLGDVRRRIVAHPRYKQGDGVWVRRTRLLVTVLSDAMDIALAGDAPMQAGAARRRPAQGAAPKDGGRSLFAIPRAEARRAAEDALREVSQKPAIDLVAGGYGLFREVMTGEDSTQVIQRAGPDVRRVGAALVSLFRGDALGGTGPSMGVALLDALAAMRLDAASYGGATGDDIAASLTAYATSFYAKGQPDQGDLCLLAENAIASFAKAPLPQSALDLAAREHSRVAWVLRVANEVRASGTRHRPPDPAAYADELRNATDDACQVPDAEATLAVMRAIHDFGRGERRRAREALDRVLDDADERGLGVPRIAYQYQEKTATKVFQVSFDISYASGILRNASSFQLGLGLRSPGEPGGALTATLAPRESAKGGEDAARYYVYTAALAAVYGFLEGDTARATGAARRAIGAVASGVTLGHRRIVADKPGAWAEDAQPVLVLAAQLAADAGQSFLAGDLWTIVRQSLPDTIDDKGLGAILDPSVVGLAGIEELAPVATRARRSLRVLAARLPCADHKVEIGGFEEVACADYPLALSLRIADALKKLPRLRRGPEGGARCSALKSLDAFLASADRGTYDPDALARAVDDLRADGETYDAAVLLGRHKRAGHCTPPVLVAARALGRSRILGPSLRADALSAAINCTAMLGGPDVEADLALLDADTRKLPDASRNVQLVLSFAELASRTDQWGMVAALVDQPDFIARWTAIHPNAGAAALLLDHAVAAIAGGPVALDRTKDAHQMLCETLRSAERADLCAVIDALRAPLSGPMSERQRYAKEAVRKLTASASAPPSRGSRRP